MRFVTYSIMWAVDTRTSAYLVQGHSIRYRVSLFSVIHANDTKHVRTPKLFLAMSGD